MKELQGVPTIVCSLIFLSHCFFLSSTDLTDYTGFCTCFACALPDGTYERSDVCFCVISFILLTKMVSSVVFI